MGFDSLHPHQWSLHGQMEGKAIHGSLPLLSAILLIHFRASVCIFSSTLTLLHFCVITSLWL